MWFAVPRSIEVARLWVRGRPTRLIAAHGAERATLELGERVWMSDRRRRTQVRPIETERRVARVGGEVMGGAAGHPSRSRRPPTRCYRKRHTRRRIRCRNEQT